MKEILMKFSTVDVAVVVAIITLVAGIIVAIINAYSNYKTNNARIESEEKQASLPYLNLIIKEIKEAIIEIDKYEVKPQTNISKMMEKIIESNRASLTVFEKVYPYLKKEDRNRLLKQYGEIKTNLSQIQIYYFTKKRIPEDDEHYFKMAQSNVEKEVKMKGELKKVLCDELSIIMDFLWKNTGV